MSQPPTSAADESPVTPARQKFLEHLQECNIRPLAHEHYVRWAESWTKAHGQRSAEATAAFFDALGRSAQGCQIKIF
jgi:hypothetical protein